MTSYLRRAEEAESAIRKVADDAQKYVSQIGARSALLEAAMRVILKHKLADEFVSEHAKVPSDPDETARLRAENARLTEEMEAMKRILAASPVSGEVTREELTPTAHQGS